MGWYKPEGRGYSPMKRIGSLGCQKLQIYLYHLEKGGGQLSKKGVNALPFSYFTICIKADVLAKIWTTFAKWSLFGSKTQIKGQFSTFSVLGGLFSTILDGERRRKRRRTNVPITWFPWVSDRVIWLSGQPPDISLSWLQFEPISQILRWSKIYQVYWQSLI